MRAAVVLFMGFLLGVSLLSCKPKVNEKAILFSYFMGNGEDGLHLAYSLDGYSWKNINRGKTMLLPLVGESVLMRDPCITSGPDGTFHMVWTTSWSGKTIGYAHSTDLISWSKQVVIPVMVHEDSVMNCWAPEINYDPKEDNFIIYWSSTITDQFPETAHSTKNGKRRNHRIYFTTTKDFKTFSGTKLFYDPGFNVIDASITPVGEKYAMFIKNETELPEAEKNISLVFADAITGPYGTPDKPITGDYWAEGPTAIEINGRWHVYFDKYRKHEFGLITSDDLENWTDESESLRMPDGIRHGTVFEVDRMILDNLLKAEISTPSLYRDISRKGRPHAKDPTVAYFNEKYFMYYTLLPGELDPEKGCRIGLAVSEDLNHWEKTGEIFPEADYEKNGLCAPEAQVIGDKIHLFYQTYGNRAHDAICHAVSADGINFTRNSTNPIFSPQGDWNAGRAIDAEVFLQGDSVFLYWATRDSAYVQQLLGVSVAPLSGDFKRGSWTQLSTKPLMKPELPWEMNCIEAASVFEAHGRYYMFYAGAYNHEGQQIGLAVSEDLINWKRTSDQPVFPKGKANAWNAWESGHPGVFMDPHGEMWLFYQGNPDRGYTYYLSKQKFSIGQDDSVTFY